MSQTQLQCWHVNNFQSIQLFRSISLHQNQPVACIADDGDVVCVSNGNLFCEVYEEGHQVVTLDIVQMVRQSGNQGFMPYNSDQITELRFVGQVLRIYYLRDLTQHFLIDVDVEELTA